MRADDFPVLGESRYNILLAFFFEPNLSYMKICARCKCPKPIGDFNKNSLKPDGLQIYCKVCKREYYLANAEVVKARSRRYYASNTESVNKKNKARYRKNKDKYLAACRTYYLENKPKIQAYYKEYAKNNRARVAAHKYAYRERNPEKYQVYAENRRSRKALAPGFCTPDQWQARWDLYGGKCYLRLDGCTINATAIDHVVPLSKGGTNWPANLRPICNHCNSVKSDRSLKQLRRENG